MSNADRESRDGEALAALQKSLADTEAAVNALLEKTERAINGCAAGRLINERRDLLVSKLTLGSVEYNVVRVDTTGEDKLTRRELEIAKLAAEGRANKAIADQLEIRPSTVAAHLRRVDAKLGLTGRADLLRVFAAPRPFERQTT